MDDRQRIINAFEAGEDFLAIATALNIKRSSAYSIVRTYTYQATGRVEILATRID